MEDATMIGACDDATFTAMVQALAGLTDPTTAATTICENLATVSTTASDALTETQYGVNTFFMIFGGALVFFMHGGFAMLEAGAIRSKNAMNILLQTILDASASSIMWYIVGFGFAYGRGNNPNGFIGDANFGTSRFESQWSSQWGYWFFQWAFATTAATIPAGSVAERFNFNAYLGYSLFVAGFVYPVVVHWAWSIEGWMSKFNTDLLFDSGYIDFAGSGVVHMVGGFTGLAGAFMVGPRLGRFDADGNPVDMPGHSAILVVLGTIILWFGWYGFNPASALVLVPQNFAIVAGRCAVTTTLAGAAGGLACLVNGFVHRKAWDLISTCNGVLCGFVSITAGCATLEPWAAIIAGAVGGVWFDLICAVFLKLKIDDPVSAAPMHGFCGMWGVLVVGFLAKKEYVIQAYGTANYYGCFYPGGGGNLLAAQLIGIIVIMAWVLGLMLPFFFIFKKLGMLRIPPEQEEMGLDRSKHGGSAYNTHGGPGVSPGNDIMRMGGGGTKPSHGGLVSGAPAEPL